MLHPLLPCESSRRLSLLVLSCAFMALTPLTVLRAGSVIQACNPEPAATGIAYGDIFAVDCSITPGADLDQFPLEAAAGDVLRLVGVDTGSFSTRDICLELIGPDPDLPRTVCANVGAVVEEVITVSGDYTVLVTEQGNDAPIPYTLSVERIFPGRSARPALTFGTVVQDDLFRNTDAYRLAATAGDFLRFIGTDKSNFSTRDLCLEVIGPSGATVIAPVCANVGLQQDLVAPETGEYSVLLYEQGYNDPIPYDINVECLSGVCAPVVLPSFSADLGVFIDGSWFLDRNGDFSFDPAKEVAGWGSPGDIPVRGDWNGDGFLDLGVFSDGTWFIDRNGDSSFYSFTEVKGWGAPGWIPVVGDWNGDGVTDLGAVDPATSTWFIDRNGDFIYDPATDIQGWGSPGDIPVVGDWDGDGDDDVGVYSGGVWFIDFNGDGGFQPGTDERGWGVAGWIPVVGDWNGDGADQLGAVEPSTMTWFRDMNGDFGFDPATDIVGWGPPGSTPVVGDWDDDKDDDVGVFIDGVWFIDRDGNQGFDPATEQKGWGVTGWTPVAGPWGSVP